MNDPITAEQLVDLDPQDWVRERPRVYRHVPTGHVVHAYARDGAWNFSQNRVGLGSVRKLSPKPFDDLWTASGPEAQATITRWTRWMQVQLCLKQAPAGRYFWHVSAGLVQGNTEDILIPTPLDAQATLEGLALVLEHQIGPIASRLLSIEVPGTAHGRMAVLQNAAQPG